MNKILVHEFVSLDGVFEAPSWAASYPFEQMGEAIGGIVGTCSAILLGRRTYEMFAPAWSARTAEDDPGAPFFNDSPKHVVSSTLEHADWSNSSVLGPYDAGAIRALKEHTHGDLYVSGSGTLVRAMIADGLVDELHLFVFPLTLGAGARLFGDSGPEAKFALGAGDVYDSGVIHLDYRPL